MEKQYLKEFTFEESNKNDKSEIENFKQKSAKIQKDQFEIRNVPEEVEKLDTNVVETDHCKASKTTKPILQNVSSSGDDLENGTVI